jgi:hypothetical protein
MATRRLPQIPSIPHDLPDDLRRVLLAMKEHIEVMKGLRPNQSALDRVATKLDMIDAAITNAEDLFE